MDDVICDIQDAQYYIESIIKKCKDKATKKRLRSLLDAFISLEAVAIAEYHALLDKLYSEELL